MRRPLPLLLLVAILAACQTTQPDPNQVPLEASEGVKEYFEPGADKAAAAENIRCEKRRELGSRMTKRVCRTEAEWAEGKAPRVIHRWREVDAALDGGG
ncbi:MAG: hypothetical protein AAGA23_09565 [Pseudomonadota bacterium]